MGYNQQPTYYIKFKSVQETKSNNYFVKQGKKNMFLQHDRHKLRDKLNLDIMHRISDDMIHNV